MYQQFPIGQITLLNDEDINTKLEVVKEMKIKLFNEPRNNLTRKKILDNSRDFNKNHTDPATQEGTRKMTGIRI